MSNDSEKGDQIWKVVVRFPAVAHAPGVCSNPNRQYMVSKAITPMGIHRK